MCGVVFLVIFLDTLRVSLSICFGLFSFRRRVSRGARHVAFVLVMEYVQIGGRLLDVRRDWLPVNHKRTPRGSYTIATMIEPRSLN